MLSGVNVSFTGPKATSSPLRKITSSKEQFHGAQVVMADDDEFALVPSGQGTQQFAQDGLRVAVQPGEGFVEQVNVRPLRHRAREEGALLLAAGERADLAVGEVWSGGWRPGPRPPCPAVVLGPKLPQLPNAG